MTAPTLPPRPIDLAHAKQMAALKAAQIPVRVPQQAKEVTQ